MAKGTLEGFLTLWKLQSENFQFRVEKHGLVWLHMAPKPIWCLILKGRFLWAFVLRCILNLLLSIFILSLYFI